MTDTTVQQIEADGKEILEILKGLDASEIIRLLGEMMINELMSTDADTICGVPYGVRDPLNRETSRNGYRTRSMDTTAGTIELNIPKLRNGTYFPDWFTKRSKRSDDALWAAVAEIYTCGVSTRKVDRVIKALGIENISSSQVSRMCTVLDEEVSAFLGREFQGNHPFLWLDATYIKCRINGRVVSVALFIATTVGSEGKREIAGISLYPSETYEAWREFCDDLRLRGIKGVQLITSDANEGLKRAITEIFPQSSWQRCRTHLSRDICAHVHRSQKGEVGDILNRIFTSTDSLSTKETYREAINKLERISPKAAQTLEDAEDDVLSYLDFPRECWRKIQSNNNQERLNREIKRRTRVIGVFPSEPSVVRLVGSLLSEIDRDWDSRAYMAEEKIKEIIERSEAFSKDKAAIDELKIKRQVA